MPINRLITKTSTQITASAVDDETRSNLFDFIEAFLTLNPSPSDEQVHALSSAVNMDHEIFEEVMYEILADIISASTSIKSDAFAEHDGEPDLETLGQPDPLKEASESDGKVDTELLDAIQNGET